MGIITISLNEKAEALLRKLASEKYPARKGALAKIIEEALLLLAEKYEKEKQIKIL